MGIPRRSSTGLRGGDRGEIGGPGPGSRPFVRVERDSEGRLGRLPGVSATLPSGHLPMDRQLFEEDTTILARAWAGQSIAPMGPFPTRGGPPPLDLTSTLRSSGPYARTFD